MRLAPTAYGIWRSACLFAVIQAMSLPAHAGNDKRELIVPSAPRVALEAQWTERVERGVAFGYCTSADCAMFYLVVRNDSDRAMQCTGHLEVVPTANAKGPNNDHEEQELVIQPGQEDTLVSLPGDAQTKPRGHGTSCRVIRPDGGLVTPPGCAAEFEHVETLGGFYPAGSLRRQETGSVTVEFTLAAELGPGSDVELAASSGFSALDAAALKLIRAAPLRTSCAGQRFSKTLHFSLEKVYQGIDASGWNTYITAE